MGSSLRLPARLGMASSVILAVVLIVAMFAYFDAHAIEWTEAGHVISLTTPALTMAALAMLSAAGYMFERRIGAHGAFKYAVLALAAYVGLNFLLYFLAIAFLYAYVPRYGITPFGYLVVMTLPAYITGIVMSYLVRRSLNGIAVAAPPDVSRRLRRAGTLYLLGAVLTAIVIGFIIASVGMLYAASAFSSLASRRY